MTSRKRKCNLCRRKKGIKASVTLWFSLEKHLLRFSRTTLCRRLSWLLPTSLTWWLGLKLLPSKSRSWSRWRRTSSERESTPHASWPPLKTSSWSTRLMSASTCRASRRSTFRQWLMWLLRISQLSATSCSSTATRYSLDSAKLSRLLPTGSL